MKFLLTLGAVVESSFHRRILCIVKPTLKNVSLEFPTYLNYSECQVKKEKGGIGEFAGCGHSACHPSVGPSLAKLVKLP